jgi:hypothetical protein
MAAREETQLETRYSLLTPIGSGGHGEVWLARDRLLERNVALKRIQPGCGLGLESLRHEARALAQLNHPAIVSLYDLAEFENETWMVMEHVSGRSLRDLLEDGPLPESAVASIARQALAGLAAAHAAGIIHNDLKPENILIDRSGKARLTDFGISGFNGSTLSPGEARELFGTLGYIAPEVLSGGQRSPASDIYGLGVTLSEAVSGVRPEGPHIAGEQPRPRLPRKVSRRFAAILRVATEKDPSKRFPTAAAFAAAIGRLDGRPTTRLRPAVAPPARTGRTVPQRVAGLAAALAGVAMLVVAARALPARSEGDPGGVNQPATRSLEVAAEPSPTAQEDTAEPTPAPAVAEATIQPTRPVIVITGGHATPAPTHPVEVKRDPPPKKEAKPKH